MIIIQINQRSKNNGQVFETEELNVWRATAQDDSAEYLAIFNISEQEQSGSIALADVNLAAVKAATELWGRYDVTLTADAVQFSALKPHDVILLKLTA